MNNVITVSYTHLDVYKRQALKGESKTQAADLEQIKKEHPLLAVLQVNPSGQGPVAVSYTHLKAM